MLGDNKRNPLSILRLVHRILCQPPTSDHRTGRRQSILTVTPELYFFGDDQILDRYFALQDFGPFVHAVPFDLGKIGLSEQQPGAQEIYQSCLNGPDSTRSIETYFKTFSSIFCAAGQPSRRTVSIPLASKEGVSSMDSILNPT